MIHTNGNGIHRPGSWADLFHGGNSPTTNAVALMQELVANLTLTREQFMNRLADPRRDLNKECGYPDIGMITPQLYQDLFDRDPIAARVVEIWPRESWAVQPTVYESEDSEEITPFEEGWDAFGRQLLGEQSWHGDEQGNPLWEYLRRGDELSGIGQYGVLLYGFDDGLPLRQPVKGLKEAYSAPAGRDKDGQPIKPSVNGTYQLTFNREQTKGRRVLYLRCFPEALAPITLFESNPTSPRFGQPVEYSLTFNDPNQGQSTGVGLAMSTLQVHWSRIQHLADVSHQASGSEVFAPPRMRPVLNRLLDLQKIYGADGETYWRNCVLKLFFETHPQLGGDVLIDKASLKTEMEQMMNGLQQWMATSGLSVKSVSPAVSDPGSHIDKHLEAIAIKLNVPLRIFKGSERGELASSQDERAHRGRVKERQQNYLTPRVIIPLVDRLISLGVLPEPEEYHIEWPDIDSGTDAEKAAVAQTRTAALAAYVAGGCEAVIPPMDFLTRFLGFDEEEAAVILESAAEANEDRMQSDMEKQREMIDAGLAPDPAEAPQQKQFPLQDKDKPSKDK